MPKLDLPTDVTVLPIWTPWIFVESRPVKLGHSMPKSAAWALARHEMDARDDVMAMTVRRDGESWQ